MVQEAWRGPKEHLGLREREETSESEKWVLRAQPRVPPVRQGFRVLAGPVSPAEEEYRGSRVRRVKVEDRGRPDRKESVKTVLTRGHPFILPEKVLRLICPLVKGAN